MKKRLKNDIYDGVQGENRNAMGKVPNKGVGKGSGPREKKGLKMISTTAIRTKKRIQWDRYQITGRVGPRLQFFYFYFFTPMELHSELNNNAVVKCTNS
jgi:hypothetical protein